MSTIDTASDTTTPAPASVSLSDMVRPVTVAGLELSSPFVMAPMTRNFSPGGVPTEEVAAYYRRRAEHKVGLILTEGVFPDHPSAGDAPAVPRLAPWSADGWRRVVEEVHAAGGKIFPQLWHMGGNQPIEAAGPVVTPSGIDGSARRRGEALTTPEIDELVQRYADSARLAYELGFDGVEIHSAHGYLLDAFLWEVTNRRRDEYGKDLAGRTRLTAEVIAAVRAATSPDFPISVRFSQWKGEDYGARVSHSPAELEALLTPFVEAGATILHPSTRRHWEPGFEGSELSLAGWTKKLTGLPTIVVGSVGLNTPFLERGEVGTADVGPLLERYEGGEFDLIAVGRALLANPDWITKTAAGRFDELTPWAKGVDAKLW
ncbi:NADH:flavin oxidoreductase [Streptomyces sp. XM4193]|uniref:NADH:flavin oxidoreductase n=1 Tax=Streptomyces sp. XM4193 TaxID=2929782 RepID=UPI001FFBDD38|nr:NADH:flavin oxidoreductase [Streptomyces sp. XM4193]MCK1796197.1 NADH:flavin oxidoreductase [Streptomyces sp. XM4193]